MAFDLLGNGVRRDHTPIKVGVIRRRVGSGRIWGLREVAQIGCYMTDEEIRLLNEYARSIEVTRAAVCSLVIQRELRVRQLSRVLPLRLERGGVEVRRRVTVHIGNAALKLAFTEHVRSLGLGSDEAAFALFKKELKERWLFNTFGHQENHG